MTTFEAAGASRPPQIHDWLVDAGFSFDPFVHLDASMDSRLGAYLIAHHAFAAMWGDSVGFALAPAGGGKTALRIQVMRACWRGPSIDHPFPIPYVPAMGSRGELPTTLMAHTLGILQSGALQLLLALLVQPFWWDVLDQPTRRLIKGLLDFDLPAPLSHYLDQLAEADDLVTFLAGLGQSAFWTDLPSYDRWGPIHDALNVTATTAVPTDAAKRLELLIDILVGAIGLSSVYLLVDGIDGFVETAHDPSMAATLVEPLLSQATRWSKQGLYFKAFFPIEVLPVLERDHPTLLSSAHRAALQWSTPSLADVIRQRVFVATEGTFGSLDALSTPNLVDVETQLARAVLPLPREVIVLTNQLLWEHVRHNNGADKLDAPDLGAALAWYRDQSVA